MGSLMSPNQSSFIYNHSIHENIIVVQEILHSMHQSKYKVGSFAIKVDLAKTYDNTSWKFLHYVLTEVAFLESLIDLIMSAMSLVKMSVLWKHLCQEIPCPVYVCALHAQTLSLDS